MFTCFNGAERTKDDFKRIMKDADERYVVEKFGTSAGGAMSAVVVSWKSS